MRKIWSPRHFQGKFLAVIFIALILEITGELQSGKHIFWLLLCAWRYLSVHGPTNSGIPHAALRLFSLATGEENSSPKPWRWIKGIITLLSFHLIQRDLTTWDVKMSNTYPPLQLYSKQGLIAIPVFFSLPLFWHYHYGNCLWHLPGLDYASMGNYHTDHQLHHHLYHSGLCYRRKDNYLVH